MCFCEKYLLQLKGGNHEDRLWVQLKTCYGTLGLLSYLLKSSQKCEKDSSSNNVVKFVNLFKSAWSYLRTAELNNHHRLWASQLLFSWVSWLSRESMFWSAVQSPGLWWTACRNPLWSQWFCAWLAVFFVLILRLSTACELFMGLSNQSPLPVLY